MHGLTPRLHGSPTCLPGPSLLYCDHGPRSPSSLSAAVTSGTGRAALFLPSNALVSRVSPRCGYDMPQQRRRRCRASQGMKKRRRPRRRPRLKLSDRAGPDQCPVPGENTLFPAQIAGFLAVSRPVPVYPVFLNYVVPVQNWCCRDLPLFPHPRFLAARGLGRRDATCSSTVGTRYSDCTLVLTFLESLLVAVRFPDAPAHGRRIDCTGIKISYIPAEKTGQLR